MRWQVYREYLRKKKVFVSIDGEVKITCKAAVRPMINWRSILKVAGFDDKHSVWAVWAEWYTVWRFIYADYNADSEEEVKVGR